MYLDRSSATKRLKRTTREHNLLLVRLHCLWNAHKDIQIQSWALRTQGMTQQWTFLCIFYSRSTFIQVTWKEELLRFYTWVIIWVRRTSSKKCPQQLFAVPGKQKKVFSTRLLQTFSLGFFSFTWSYIRTKAFSNSRKDDLEQWK